MVIRVKTSRCKEGWFPLIWKFAHAQCLHCAVQCHYSFFFFFPFMPDSWYSFKTCLWSAQQGTKESFEKTVTWEKRTDFFFLFNIAWTLPAYAHAQNCPSRLTMYHLFSLDPIWIYLQTSNAFKPILLAVCFAAYCSRYATDTWEKR